MKKILFKVKATNETDGLFVEGYATRYGEIDRTVYKDCLIYGCFKKTLTEQSINEDIIVSFNHDRSNAVGKIVELEDRPEGLWTKIKISDAETKLKTKILEGIYNKMSLGFLEVVSKSKKIFDSLGNFIKNDIKEAKLVEIAIVKRSGLESARFNISEKMLDIIENENEYENEQEIIDKVKSLLNEPNHSGNEPNHSGNEPNHSGNEPNHSEDEPITFDKFIQNFTIN